MSVASLSPSHVPQSQLALLWAWTPKLELPYRSSCILSPPDKCVEEVKWNSDFENMAWAKGAWCPTVVIHPTVTSTSFPWDDISNQSLHSPWDLLSRVALERFRFRSRSRWGDIFWRSVQKFGRFPLEDFHNFYSKLKFDSRAPCHATAEGL